MVGHSSAAENYENAAKTCENAALEKAKAKKALYANIYIEDMLKKNRTVRNLMLLGVTTS